MSSQSEPGLCRTTIWDTATTGTFRWTINDFKNRPEKCTEKLRSPCFNEKGQGDLGTKWQLVIYPKGKGKEDASEDYVDMTLYNKSQVEVTAEFKYEIIDCAGTERESITSTARRKFATSGFGAAWGLNKWLKREKLNNHPDLEI